MLSEMMRSIFDYIRAEGWSSTAMAAWFMRDSYKGARRPTQKLIDTLMHTGEGTPAMLKTMDDWLKEGSKAPEEPPIIEPRQHAPKTPTTVPIPAGGIIAVDASTLHGGRG